MQNEYKFIFNTLPFAGKSDVNIDNRLPRKLEWSGFVLNSRSLWKDRVDKVEWIKDIDMLDGDVERVHWVGLQTLQWWSCLEVVVVNWDKIGKNGTELSFAEAAVATKDKLQVVLKVST
ncbi:hypothetical protein V6N13_112270 [Hibiscus sabdariffa]|uniref:Uncharacterized protein n=1 Tax=Hibiscus sabdariffa TaxID=183260 RepID=A0ABR2TN82_9ROSI